MWRDTFLEWALFSYREDVWRGLAHIQEIRRDVLSESKEHLNLPVCLLHKWTSDRSDLYLWNIEGCNTKLCLTILWWSIFLVCFIHKDAHHIKYKIQSYRNLKDQLCKSDFHPPILKDPSPFSLDNTAAEDLNFSYTSLHDLTSYMFIFTCEWLFLNIGRVIGTYFLWNFLYLIHYVFHDNVFFRVTNAVGFIKIIWVIQWVFTNTASITLDC